MSADAGGPDYEGGFDDQPWHDATLLQLRIDRRSPGTADDIELLISWPNQEISVVIFTSCYEASLSLRFGVRSPESILRADEHVVLPDVERFRAAWASLGVPPESMRLYEIETNTTAGLIKIYAQGWRIESRAFGYNDVVRVLPYAGIEERRGTLGSIVCITEMPGSEARYVIEFSNGESIEVPASWIELIEKDDKT